MHDETARGLGYFSIALGVAELAMPRAICRAAGIEVLELLVRGYGVREIATGVAILMTHDATPWIWGRVAGDAVDIATVAMAPPERHGEDRKPWALGALLAVTAVDLFCASCLNAEKGGRRTARADYRNRSGFPQGRKGGAWRGARFPDPARHSRAGSAAAADDGRRAPSGRAFGRMGSLKFRSTIDER